MSIQEYEMIIGLEVHVGLKKKPKHRQKSFAAVPQNLERNPIPNAVRFVWGCQGHCLF